MSHKIVRSICESRLSAWAKARTPAVRIAYEGVSFEPLSGETYLKAFVLPAATEAITLQGLDRVFIGIFQISVVAPVGKGTGGAEGIAEELAELFPVDLRLERAALRVMAVTPLEQGPSITSDTTLTVPTSFTYRAYRD